MGPDMRQFLTGVLENNLGVVGTFLARRWGLYEGSGHLPASHLPAEGLRHTNDSKEATTFANGNPTWAMGAEIQVQDTTGNWGTRHITLTTNSQTILGAMKAQKSMTPDLRVRAVDRSGRLIDLLG